MWDRNSEFKELSWEEFRNRSDAHGECCIYKGAIYKADANGYWQYARSEDLPPEFRASLLLAGVPYKES